jgi:hypothetical protein
MERIVDTYTQLRNQCNELPGSLRDLFNSVSRREHVANKRSKKSKHGSYNQAQLKFHEHYSKYNGAVPVFNPSEFFFPDARTAQLNIDAIMSTIDQNDGRRELVFFSPVVQRGGALPAIIAYSWFPDLQRERGEQRQVLPGSMPLTEREEVLQVADWLFSILLGRFPQDVQETQAALFALSCNVEIILDFFGRHRASRAAWATLFCMLSSLSYARACVGIGMVDYYTLLGYQLTVGSVIHENSQSVMYFKARFANAAMGGCLDWRMTSNAILAADSIPIQVQVEENGYLYDDKLAAFLYPWRPFLSGKVDLVGSLPFWSLILDIPSHKMDSVESAACYFYDLLPTVDANLTLRPECLVSSSSPYEAAFNMATHLVDMAMKSHPSLKITYAWDETSICLIPVIQGRKLRTLHISAFCSQMENAEHLALGKYVMSQGMVKFVTRGDRTYQRQKRLASHVWKGSDPDADMDLETSASSASSSSFSAPPCTFLPFTNDVLTYSTLGLCPTKQRAKNEDSLRQAAIIVQRMKADPGGWKISALPKESLELHAQVSGETIEKLQLKQQAKLEKKSQMRQRAEQESRGNPVFPLVFLSPYLKRSLAELSRHVASIMESPDFDPSTTDIKSLLIDYVDGYIYKTNSVQYPTDCIGVVKQDAGLPDDIWKSTIAKERKVLYGNVEQNDLRTLCQFITTHSIQNGHPDQSDWRYTTM